MQLFLNISPIEFEEILSISRFSLMLRIKVFARLPDLKDLFFRLFLVLGACISFFVNITP